MRKIIRSKLCIALFKTLGGKIGCQIANPDVLVIDIDGDGSFHHTLAELKTIREHKLPIKIVIMNDGHMSMVRVWEELFFDKRYTATALPQNPDYVALA